MRGGLWPALMVSAALHAAVLVAHGRVPAGEAGIRLRIVAHGLSPMPRVESPEDFPRSLPQPEDVTPDVEPVLDEPLPEVTEVVRVEPPAEPEETPFTPCLWQAPPEPVGHRESAKGAPDIRARYLARVAALLEKAKRYPLLARRRGQEGTAVVRFSIGADGTLSGLEVARSSGARLLDEAAMDMVRRAAPFPPVPAELGGALVLSVPVVFELR